jgi:hypothetical protein
MSYYYCLVGQKPYQYKPLPSKMIAHQEMNEDSYATVLMAADATLKILSLGQETKVKTMVLDGCGKCNMVHMAG